MNTKWKLLVVSLAGGLAITTALGAVAARNGSPATGVTTTATAPADHEAHVQACLSMMGEMMESGAMDSMMGKMGGMMGSGGMGGMMGGMGGMMGSGGMGGMMGR